MTGTDIREALHAVADTATVPEQDRVTFQKALRRERRARLAGRSALGVAVAAATAAIVATTALPFLRDGSALDLQPAAPSGAAGTVDLETPVYLVADGALTAIDPQGGVHDLGLRSGEVIGYTSEFVYAIGAESQVVRFDVSNSDEGPGGWRFERVESGVRGAVQSAQLSADGRWLGWVDLQERLHTIDLKAGTAAEPVPLRGSAYLVDLAQGTGHALVSVDGRVALITPSGRVAIPTTGGGGWSATASRDLVAVPGTDGTTRIFDVSAGEASPVDTVPGSGVLAPYGTGLVAVRDDEDDAGSSAVLWTPDAELRLLVPGRPSAAAWADEDTVVVTTTLEGRTELVGCEVSDPTGTCNLLETGGAGNLVLAR